MSDNPRRDYRFYLHRDHFLRFIDPARTTGLEIGAFDLPLVETDEGKCDFADFRTTEELKALARTLPGHSPERTLDVRYDLRQGYDAITWQYDWVAAAHVAEHIPDLIGWLNTVHGKLVANGLLFLVLPDKNYTYDFHRSVTRLSDCVDAHHARLTRPSFKHVFDHHFYTLPAIDPGIFWSGGQIPIPTNHFAEVYALSARTTTEYIDAHCSVFTPTSFAKLIGEMIAAGLIHFRLEEVRSTQYNQMDFSAVLRAI